MELSSQIFKFVSADHSAALQDVSLLINNNSGKSFDVPNDTLESGARIVQMSQITGSTKDGGL